MSTVRRALNLPYAALAIARGQALETVAESGSAPAQVERLALIHQGETVGHLLVSPREPGEAFAGADRALLGTLAHQAAAAVHALQLHGELRQARERLVLAREEERRRLRHDLHDELAPTLAALSMTSARAADRLATDPRAARTLLVELQQSLRACIADVRRLVYDLRPPILDELGLRAAIEERAQQFTSEAGLHVTVVAPRELVSLPAAVEVAAYRIVLEALMNVSRHAQARACEVELTTTSAALQVRVTDDGRGLPERFRAGVGLASMRERASELGGVCTIETRSPNGTCVTALLPLRALPAS